MSLFHNSNTNSGVKQGGVLSHLLFSSYIAYYALTFALQTDECYNIPCYNGATCTDLFLDFTCTCMEGFNGTLCDEDVNECLSSPCSNHNQTCVNYMGGYECLCELGYEGAWCELEVNECESGPCLNEVSVHFFDKYSR